METWETAGVVSCLHFIHPTHYCNAQVHRTFNKQTPKAERDDVSNEHIQNVNKNDNDDDDKHDHTLFRGNGASEKSEIIQGNVFLRKLVKYEEFFFEIPFQSVLIAIFVTILTISFER
ncbi:MAG: hypothetical protein ACRC78_07445 [Planktothrix sp.]